MIKVLIVEDDPMVAQINKRYVESLNGFKVLGISTNGNEALKFVKTNNVDLIILDIYMPNVDGIKFLKEMRKNNIMTNVIMVTAANETNSIDEALTLGAIDYLVKPFEYERLKSSLESYLQRYKLLNKSTVVSQEDIDKITMRKNNIKNDYITQKGLHVNTLNRIRKFMRDNCDRILSTDEIAEKLTLTKVTVRRYLDYLEVISEVELIIEYGSIGRPSHLYKFIK